jgi:hypothetical protein
MLKPLSFSVLVAMCCSTTPFVSAQEPVRYRAAVVALATDPALRAEFERGLVAKAVSHDYDAVTSYDLVPDPDDPNLLETLAAERVQAVLMVRPAAVGEGSSLDSVRREVTPELLADMRAFAERVSASGADDLIAVVHMAIYTLEGSDAELISAGAVWLDEPVATQAQGIERLQNLIVANVDAARPAIREHLGLAPLE